MEKTKPMEITHSYEGLGIEYVKAREGIPGFARFMVSKIGPGTAEVNLPFTIVELGVGSGQQTRFVELELKNIGLFQYRIFAYDKSYQLKEGEKPGQLNILKERITRGDLSDRVIPCHLDFDGNVVPLESESVYFSYMAHVFHHLKNKQDVLNEIARVTIKEGMHFILGVTIEDLENHPLNSFFPMKYEYDSKRYPTRSQLRQMFESAGFYYEKPFPLGKNYERPIDRAFLASIENTTLDSVLRMIKDNDPLAFQEGVSRVRKEVELAEKSGKYKTYFTDIAQVFWGEKSKPAG
jgi:ubiquinone/menaquinone biosynthesis C-methylase UbiE